MFEEELIQSLAGFMARQPEVRLAYLFGSHARGEANALSDVDLAVWLDERLTAAEQGRVHVRLMSDLMSLLQRDDIDLVILNRASLLLRHRVLRDGRLLFAADEGERARFATVTIERYLDHRYMYDVLEEAMVTRLREGRFGRRQIDDSRAFRQARAVHRQAANGD
jgi:predicted nucleotidyltransferase